MGLEFAWWVTPGKFTLVFPHKLPGIALASLYTLLSLWLIYKRRTDFHRSKTQLWLLGLGVLLIGATAGVGVLAADLHDFIPTAPLTQLAYPPAVSLVALSGVVAIAIWWGPGPGLVAGWVLGVLQARFTLLSFNDIFAYAAWGVCTGAIIHHPYVGPFFQRIRLPVIATTAGSVTLLLLLSLNRVVEAIPPLGLDALEHLLGPINTGGGLWLVCGLAVGLVLTLLWAVAPQLRPRWRADTIPLTQRSLRARFLVALLPLILGSVFLSMFMVTNRAMQLAREQALDELDRTAAIAGDNIAHFGVSGRNLLEKFAANPLMLDPHMQQSLLEADRQLVPFFQELLLVNAEGQVIASAPQDAGDRQLTPEEIPVVNQALQFEMAEPARVTRLPSGKVRMTFVQPLFSEENGAVPGALLGRVELNTNPEMKRVLAGLQATRGVGQGFVIDDRGLIILHPQPEAILRPWSINPNVPTWEVGAGTAYRDFSPGTGEATLYYTRHIAGTPFTVVMQLPYAVVFEMSSSIFRPLLLVQLPVGVLLLILMPFLVARITQPLHTLAVATDQIAEGNLETPVHIVGEDEVAQLGSAFEAMRLRLKDRINDLSLLVQISQSVSATLTLDQGVPLILDGVLEETGAAVAHLIVLENEERSRVFSAGLSDPAFQGLDRALVAIVSRRRDPFIEQDVRDTSEVTLAGSALRSLAAFPVRLQNRLVAVLWIGALSTQAFDEGRVQFLNTLANQAAVLVENIRLFEATEDGRRRLAAILASTTDAIIVIDRARRLALANPAAQTLLNLDETTYGRPIQALNLPPPLVEAVIRLEEELPPTPSAVEFSLADRRTFYTSIAPIKDLPTTRARSDVERQPAGWVAVMRDVTHFKELDEMKTDFVSTVSHDLRAPLTFMRGYVTMLTMVGELNDKQQEYQGRILEGIEQMSALIDDLLNLRRVEAGLGIRQEPCRLGLVLLEAVDTMRARALAKGVTLKLEPPRPITSEALAEKGRELLEEVLPEPGASMSLAQRASATVLGDRTLLRQAIANLVDNAVKYTPAGGTVTVGMDLSENVAIVRVSDTGIGITPENQVRLFEKFYRIKRRETTDIAGTGLGLALVKSIVEHHHGRVWLESELNKGSTFYIALPLYTLPAASEEHPT